MPFYYRSHGKKEPNRFVATVRRIYNPLGVQCGYNFPLWIIFALGFSASRAMYLDYDNTYKTAKLPIGEYEVTLTSTFLTWLFLGDWEYQSHGRGRVGMLMHLAAVIPIGFLLPWQFLPIVRHKLMLFYCINGYLFIILLLICDTGAIRDHQSLEKFHAAMDCRRIDSALSLVQPGLAALFYPGCEEKSRCIHGCFGRRLPLAYTGRYPKACSYRYCGSANLCHVWCRGLIFARLRHRSLPESDVS